jgi:hypothetical protein
MLTSYYLQVINSGSVCMQDVWFFILGIPYALLNLNIRMRTVGAAEN